MKRLFFLLALSALLVPLAVRADEWTGPQPKLPTITLSIGAAQVEAEVAREPEQLERGLMFRRGLKDNVGMIFVLSKEEQANFWMKNTLIPLSVAYIDKAGKILEIYDMQPLDTRITASVSGKIAYALEMNQGWFILNRIVPGTEVKPLAGRFGEGPLSPPAPAKP